jgi:hypothetical protein
MASMFTEITTTNHNGLCVVTLTALHEVATPLQWRFTIESFKAMLDERVAANVPFGFVFDMRKVGMPPLSQIQEFVKLLEVNHVIMEAKLTGTAVITQGSIIAAIFKLIKQFYRTKKPLYFVNSVDEALEHMKV